MICDVGINDCKGWSNWKKLGKTDLRYRTYVLWKSVICRCYSSKFQKNHKTYVGCKMAKEWLYLSKFAEDIAKLDGYELWKNNPINSIALDKDILGEGQKLYGPNTCKFVTVQESNKDVFSRNGVVTKAVEKLISYGLAQRKMVLCVFPDGHSKKYESVRATADDGFEYRHVSDCCKGKRKTHKGCMFDFV